MAKTDERSTSGPSAGPSPEAIATQLERILADLEFRRSERNVAFLGFIVTESLAGCADTLSAYRIGVEVFGREPSFEPSFDPIVRNQASRLRRALERYYFLAGSEDPIRIDLPTGGYVPTFQPVGDDDGSGGDAPAPSRRVVDPNRPSIAVLPFTDLSDDPEQSFMPAGLVEELAIELSRFQDFFVVGPQSTLKYQGAAHDLREIGRELEVRYVLTGSVARSTERLRVSVELNDTRTGGLLWADRFEADLAASDIFDLQDRIAADVVSRVADSYGVIPRTLAQASSDRRTGELSSYEAVLRFHHFHSGSDTSDHVAYEKVRRGLERAVEKDSDYALAWAKLSEILCSGYIFGYSDEPNLLRTAMKAARRAASLVPGLQAAQSALLFCFFARGQREEVVQVAERVIELNPNSAFPLGFAGAAMALAGEWKRGLELVDEAIRLNPYNPGWLLLPRYGLCLSEADYEGALDIAKTMECPGSDLSLVTEAAALGLLGRRPEAERALTRLLELRAGFSQPLEAFVRNIMFDEGIGDRMVEGLRRAGYEERSDEA